MTSSDYRIRQEVENLAALRIRKGISLSAIEKATKIRVAYLAAIEEGRFEELPEGVYRANYLKQYAAQIDPVILERLTTELRHWQDPAGADGEECSTKRTFWWARRWFPGLAVAVVIGVPVHLSAQAAPAHLCPPDRRCEALVKFYKNYGSALGQYAGEFLLAAYKHHLDGRLLPSITMVESSGGKFDSHGNVFGWISGRADFRGTLRANIAETLPASLIKEQGGKVNQNNRANDERI